MKKEIISREEKYIKKTGNQKKYSKKETKKERQIQNK